MEQIAVIANNKKYAKYLADNLETYFRNEVAFHYYGTHEIEKMECIREKYIVLSAFTIFQQVKRKTTEEAKLILADLTLNRRYIDRLYKLPKATKALLVNIDYRSCMEVITMIYSAGFQDLELVPFYAGCKYDKSIQVAITPDEEQLVPDGITTVINIGERVVDLSCVWEIADILNITDPFSSEEAENAKKDIISSNVGMERFLGENESLTEQINVLLKLVRQGFLVTDVKGKIYLSNDMAKQMLKSRTEIIDGFNIAEVLPELRSTNNRSCNEERNGELINVNGVNLIVSITKIISHDEVKGSVVMLDSFLEVENRQHKIRSKITGYGHTASYTFDDILGESKVLEETKKIAMRMAKSDSSMILYGETGTGKELFAQSVHNYSNRAGYHFVAVNCSALPDNLLESELYGYEDGAFSGAKKGGKIGLFELAHQGTLFLDEIGELPLSLQAKLLRAIEEKKILRIGGMNLIDIDVRIIAATNRNLLDMVKRKEFRSDLYYRLNVLPVHIPSLKDRGKDIFMLFDSFKKSLNVEFALSSGAKARMLSHSWKGNIRELKNTAEYLANLGKAVIEECDLPFNDECENKGLSHIVLEEDQHLMEEFLQSEGRELNKYFFILEEMERCYQQRERIGRRRLLECAVERNVFITEQEIKNALIRLSAFGFVVSGRGRKGSTITESGRSLLQQLRKMV
ncbi:sigma-54 interaction domain-containing protein [Anaerovorax sp. IOR16]|uniref:sigma-54 interaction domain-containing protein n=1 Tax=Anaerovorax sp. IOR16 TaxID=2773458 RepID=UPI0019CFDD53|nr:sigma 54-interacting transcriptional regulator [Anaerovorax sp. IOR16]